MNKRDEKKARECLKCEKKFASQGWHNRICDNCLNTEAFSGIREAIRETNSRKGKVHQQ